MAKKRGRWQGHKPSAAWAKRNAAARAKGYRNYYDYRVHRYGALPASLPAASGAERARLMGQRGASALRRALAKPDRIALIVEVPEYRKGDAKGDWSAVRYVVTFTDGYIAEYVVELDDVYDLDYWNQKIEEADVEFLAYTSGAAAAEAA